MVLLEIEKDFSVVRQIVPSGAQTHPGDTSEYTSQYDPKSIQPGTMLQGTSNEIGPIEGIAAANVTGVIYGPVFDIPGNKIISNTQDGVQTNYKIQIIPSNELTEGPRSSAGGDWDGRTRLERWTLLSSNKAEECCIYELWNSQRRLWE